MYTSDFIQKVDFGRDLEHQLNGPFFSVKSCTGNAYCPPNACVAVYVDCRAAFPNLDRVTERLVHSATKLIMRTYKIVKVFQAL